MCSYDTAAAVAVSAVGVDTLFIISSYPPENPLCRVRPCWVDSIAIRTWVQHKNAIGTPSVPSPLRRTGRIALTACRHICISTVMEMDHRRLQARDTRAGTGQLLFKGGKR